MSTDTNRERTSDRKDAIAPFRPEIVVLGPGGYKGFLELGALLHLEKEHFLSDVQTYVGVSVGAVVGLLLVSGYSVVDIIAEAVETNLFQDVSHLNFEEIKTNTGLISNDSIKAKLSQMVTKKFGFVPTLNQLYMATGLVLVTVSMNIDTNTPEYFSKETEPALSCIDSVLLSMNIPFLFYKMRYKGCVFIDGAFGNPYPVDLYDDGKRDILGIYIETEDESASPISYLYRILNSSIHQIKDRIRRSSSSRCRHLVLKSHIIDVTGITVDIKAKSDMIMAGHRTAENFVRQLSAPPVTKKDDPEEEDIVIILGAKVASDVYPGLRHDTGAKIQPQGDTGGVAKTGILDAIRNSTNEV